MIKCTLQVGSISVEKVHTGTVQSKEIDTGIGALIASVVGLAKNMFERFATTVEEIHIHGTYYSAYGLA